MEAPELKETTARLLHYGEILLELDRLAADLAATADPQPVPLPAIRFVAHGRFFRFEQGVLERED